MKTDLLRRRVMMGQSINEIVIDARDGDDNATALMAVIYTKKWSKSPNYMTKREAEKVTDIGTTFRHNTNITNFDALKYFTSLTRISNYAFQGCTKITDITILNTSKMVTSASGMFTSNPTIRVPNSLLTEYQTDENWKRYTLVGY